MEYASIEREIIVDADPDVVFDVVSKPEHLREWWPDEVDLDSEVGGEGRISFRGNTAADTITQRMTIVEMRPPNHFAFRWTHAAGEPAAIDNSFLVVFDIQPFGHGTRVRMTETGFRERGWEAAVLKEAYRDHAEGWDHFIPRLEVYLARLAATV